MKKFDIVHTTVLIVAILCGYSALQQFLGILNTIFYASDIFYARSGMGTFALPTLISTCTYLIAAIILVKNSKRIANYLLGSEKQEFEEFLDDDAQHPASETTPANPSDPTPLTPAETHAAAETHEAADWHIHNAPQIP
jgi:hypothetical protein